MTEEWYDADGVLLDTIIDRPKFRELRYKKGRDIPEQYDRCQLKMDGMWGCMKISHGQWGIYSRTGKLKAEWCIGKEKIMTASETILLGEYIKNSHWGHKMNIDGNFYAFDCLKYQGLDLSDEMLRYRVNMLQNILAYDTFGFVYELPALSCGTLGRDLGMNMLVLKDMKVWYSRIAVVNTMIRTHGRE